MKTSGITCSVCGEGAGTRFKDVVVQPVAGHWHGFYTCCQCGNVNSFPIGSERVMQLFRENGAEFLPQPKFQRPICSPRSLMPLTLREVEEFTWDSQDEELFSFCVSDELKL